MYANLASPSRSIAIGMIALCFLSSAAQGQSTPSAVIDGAGMFSDEAIRKAKGELAKLDQAHGVTMTIVMVESLKGQGIDEVAIRRAQQLDHKGIFVLIARQDHKAEALASPRSLVDELGKSRLNQIRDAFLDEFRKDRIDEGLLKGVQTAASTLEAIRPARNRNEGGFLPSSPAPGTSSGTSPLVIRQQVRLSLSGAKKAIDGAEARAIKEGWKVNIAVVDDGGHLVAFARMDGARPASVVTATTKARSAATFRQASGPLEGSNDPLANLSLQNASGGVITSLKGGIPIEVEGQVIGAIGVGGGTGDQDSEVARAGIAAFLAALQAPSPGDPLTPKSRGGPGSKDHEDADPR